MANRSVSDANFKVSQFKVTAILTYRSTVTFFMFTNCVHSHTTHVIDDKLHTRTEARRTKKTVVDGTT